MHSVRVKRLFFCLGPAEYRCPRYEYSAETCEPLCPSIYFFFFDREARLPFLPERFIGLDLERDDAAALGASARVL